MTRADPPDETHPGPLARLFGLFDSVTSGIVMLVLLFVYCTVGSAGIFYPEGGRFWATGAWTYGQLRTFRGLEMTEYEWFNWWPFDLLIGLICLTITVVTLRRIRLNTINLGVWMIHTGIIILCAGSVWYFGTKLEGDTPVIRRQVLITTPSGGSASLRAIPGAGTLVDGWRFEVTEVVPGYTMLSGPDEGSQDYAVRVSVESPMRESFQRQLLARHPENTEDSILTGDPSQPLARAVKVYGRPLVDEKLQMSLAYSPQRHYYLANWVEKSWALYVREVFPEGRTGEWAQRPIDGMPLYNDYLGSPDEAWFAPGHEATPDMLDPLDAVALGTEPHDPLLDVPIRITSYLRYASIESRRAPGGAVIDPAVTVRLEDRQHEASFDIELAAFHPDEQEADVGVGFLWAKTMEERAALAEVRAPRLHFSGPGLDTPHEVPVREVLLQTPDLPFRPVPGTGYEYRVEFVQALGELGVMASVELRTAERHYRRWVFESSRSMPARDVSLSAEAEYDHDDHTGHSHAPSIIPEETYPLDPGIVVTFEPGNEPQRALLLAGPGEDDLGVVLRLGSPQDGTYLPLHPGEPVSLGGDRSLTVLSFSARSHTEERPLVVPLRERNRDARERRSMARFQFGSGGQVVSDWARFHEYVFDESDNSFIRFAPALRRHPFLPTAVDLADGRRIELLLSRRRLPLPAPVVLDDFELSSHVGGFSGQLTSIMNWTSQIRFEQGETWTPTMPVTVNAPAEYADLWYFQAQWDPPDPGRFRGQPDSEGLNYTVLGVGNRNGVGVQLFGCSVAVLGMLYAFYVKPQLLRRRRGGRDDPPDGPIAAGMALKEDAV